MASRRLLFGALVCITCILCSIAGRIANSTKMLKAPGKPFEWMDPLSYLDHVTALFAKRVQEYGVGYLPAPDKVYDLNTTRYKTLLYGSMDYIDGYVMGIENITRHPRDFIWYMDDKDNSAIIKYMIILSNVSVFYDVRVDLDVLQTPATTVLKFPINIIQVLLRYDLKSHEAGVLSMTTNSVSGPKTRFFPDSPVMQAIAYNARLTMSSSLFSDLTMWIKYPFQPILQTIVRQKSFPLKVGRARRRPRTKAQTRKLSNAS